MVWYVRVYCFAMPETMRLMSFHLILFYALTFIFSGENINFPNSGGQSSPISARSQSTFCEFIEQAPAGGSAVGDGTLLSLRIVLQKIQVFRRKIKYNIKTKKHRSGWLIICTAH
jgi:hypothetical protein